TTTGTNLIFQQNYSFGAGDGGVVEASTDGGTNWVALNAGVTNNVFSLGQPFTTISSAANPLNGRLGWIGALAATYYQNVKINLSLQFPNQNVLIRWRLGTDGATAGTFWSIDNIQVENSATPTSPSAPTFTG